VVTEDLVAEVDVERDNGDAGGLLLLLGQVGGGIRNDPDHDWSIASPFEPITLGQQARFVRFSAARLDKGRGAMLPGSARLTSPLRQAFILAGFIGFQALDSLTTHIGLAEHHMELNRVMASLIVVHGELMAYAVKGTVVAMLLAMLMMLHRGKPRVWQAYLLGAWLSAFAVVANVSQLL
jgi:Domain of unknown function (DUF5658)